MAARNAELNGSTIAHDQTPEPRDPGDPTAHAFPIPAWDRYANVRFLGQGGMGKVYLAHDPRLRRNVAIKFVHGNTPDDIRRLIAEARAQAQVSHERVCKVHEVGEVGGKVYISMQYIDGRPLSELVDELTTDQKAMVVREAAEGIHEAHRAGVIHRDIKPSNILVERGDDGKLRPYVMDFGLARSIHDDGGTLSGTVLGTPRYMAPEQARGEVGTLDRRADVYSLGATLYYLVTGKPPVHGSGAMEVLHNLMTAEPVRPRSLQRDLSPDLEAIILKCLETDRTRRYDSARAVADDLGRFLDGEPVEARVAGPWYRLRKQLAKHRRLVAVSAVALGLAVAGLAWGLQSSREAATRERLAREFTERVERIEAMARYSALSRIHDIRGDQAALRAALNTLERDVHDAGERASGPGNYALGRGYLALGDDAKARQHLESAWTGGFREPRVAYALALAMGHLYQQHMVAADRVEQKSTRQAMRLQAEHNYRDPARSYLAAARGAAEPSADYAAALLAFYTGDAAHLDEALQHLDAVRGVPWLYEVLELRGDILFTQARSHRDAGNVDLARTSYEAARQAYGAAARAGESAPSVYRSLAELERSALVVELYSDGDFRGPFERGMDATERALQVIPDDYDALTLRARLRRNMAARDASQGVDVDVLLAKALEDAQRAIAAIPSRVQARTELASIYRQRGEILLSQGRDPRDQLANAIVASKAVSNADQDGMFFNNLGLIYKIRADYEDQIGADSALDRADAILAYTRALGLDEQLIGARINLGINYFMRASRQKPVNPDADLENAIAAFDLAKLHSPKNFVLRFYRGQSYATKAHRTRALGRDPTPLWALALQEYKDGLESNATLPELHNGIGMTRLEQAQYAWDRGGDPEPLLDLALDAFREAVRLNPTQGLAYGNVGNTLIERASFQRARGEDPSVAIEAAVHELRESLQRLPGDTTDLADLGTAYSLLAGYQLEHGGDPTHALNLARQTLEQSIANNPYNARARHSLGETQALLARLHVERHRKDATDFEAAAKSFREALDLAPERWEFRISFARFCAAWAAFQRDTGLDPQATLTDGSDAIESVLRVDPRLPDALLTRASLRVLRAQIAPSDAERTKVRTEAEADRTRALETNPRLAATWKQMQSVLGQVAARLH